MVDISRGMHSLTDFKKSTSAFIDKVTATGDLVVLTVNDKPWSVIQEAAACQKLHYIAEEARILQRPARY